MSVAEERAEAPSTIAVTIDGQVVEARPGELVIDAAERAGVYIPRFCYHPRMDPVGMCRMCLVEISGPRGFSLQPACFMSVAEGQEIRTTSEPARKAQEGVLEFLLVNHPLDCPVCDKGGECPLQDQSVSHGPGESRFVEEKRHWAKPIDIGPLVALDRERCIQCARCTRFSEEIAGDAMIDFAFRGDRIEVSPFPAEPFTSYFSGNTVQICPVGALTAKPYRFKSRPWDLEQVESTCTTCAVGCRFVAQSSAGELVRYLGVDSDPVNQSWLCDKGRFGHEWVTAANRLREPAVTSNDGLIPASWQEALGLVASKLSEVLETRGPDAIGVIGGARLSNEEAYAWAKLTKGVLGTDSVDAQLGDGLPAEIVMSLPRATIDEATSARLVVLLAPDLKEELPVLYLRLAGAAKHGVEILECSPVETALSSQASLRLSYLPGEIARLAGALAGQSSAGDLSGIESADLDRARQLLGSDRGEGVVFVVGRSTIAESAEAVAHAASTLATAFPAARFLSALRRSNVHGALDMGLAPGLLPGRVPLDHHGEHGAYGWTNIPSTRGRDTKAILQAAAAGELGALILLGADPLADFPDRALAEDAFVVPPFIVAISTHPDASNRRADVVLPVAGEAEKSGTTTNLEGRVTRIAEKVVAPGTAWPAWVVAYELSRRLGSDLGFLSIEDIRSEIDAVAPSHRGIARAFSPESSANDGVIVPLPAVTVTIGARPRALDPMATPGIASADEQGSALRVGNAEPLGGEAAVSNGTVTPSPTVFFAGQGIDAIAAKLDAYSLRLFVSRRLYDNGSLVQASPSMSKLAGSATLRVHPTELERLGVASGDRLRVRAGTRELDVVAVGDAQLSRQLAVIDATKSAAGRGPQTLINAELHGTDVRLETI